MTMGTTWVSTNLTRGGHPHELGGDHPSFLVVFTSHAVVFTPSQPANQSYVELRSALADFLIFLDRLRSAKKCASKTLLPDFLMPHFFKCN